MKKPIDREIKHRGLGGSGVSSTATEILKENMEEENEPLHNGYMRRGVVDGDEKSDSDEHLEEKPVLPDDADK